MLQCCHLDNKHVILVNVEILSWFLKIFCIWKWHTNINSNTFYSVTEIIWIHVIKTVFFNHFITYMFFLNKIFLHDQMCFSQISVNKNLNHKCSFSVLWRKKFSMMTLLLISLYVLIESRQKWLRQSMMFSCDSVVNSFSGKKMIKY